ncbi:transglycosylase SLT domain-containing protein [Methylococcus sp. EFPC2]|uniref:transglycosylase SLT domain-containing protein n=1 Tax=Methylococcus sp. EFPC2 TaxID=2812648 RepID=UPI001967B0B0|nr:transglycosylase SLT domain-containing protein [Methylococcus sp. EFPC2]QSA96597.1 transglycosylase SLT domain-containing protein [Methylococcus sp. EFPC2]
MSHARRSRAIWGATLVLALLFGSAARAEFEAQRPLFAKAEEALAQNRLDEADKLIEALRGYPLYPWLKAKRTALSLDDTASTEAIDRYPWTRQTEILRARWLEKLANAGDWAAFERYYRDTEQPALQCAHNLALLQSGRAAEAYAGAEKLWASGETRPALCERLFAAWRTGPGFDNGQIWKRLSLALLKNNGALAAQLEALLPPGERERAALLHQVHDHPRLVLACQHSERPDAVSARVFVHGIERLAAEEPLLAQAAWALNQPRFPLDAETRARLDRKLATNLATDRYDQATAYLLAVPPAHADAQTRAWRVRAALRQQDWVGVLEALSLMSQEEQSQAQWRYWHGRALEALGRGAEAADLYRQAAVERDFHGYLAADRLGQPYPLVDRPADVDASVTQRLLSSEALVAIAEWRALGRDGEARAEFAFTLRSLGQADQLAAAKLAQQWGWDALAISAAAKSGAWDDLSLRFPLAFKPAVMEQATLQGLNPALLYGLIRRESAFDPGAGSSVGARGLMQLMPATGEQLARRFNEKLPGGDALFEPERNLRYGSAYLRGLLDRFGHFALAAAGYNSGPNRVDRWLPVSAPMPADIWIETIPIAETRQYVSAIVAYAAAYQLRLGLPTARITSWLPDVRPGNGANAKPDRVAAVPVCESEKGTY